MRYPVTISPMIESGELPFKWSQITGILLGVSVVAAVFFGLAWQKRQRKAARNERPPQGSKLLRPAGYSLQSRIDDLNEKWTAAVTQTVMAGAFLGLMGAVNLSAC